MAFLYGGKVHFPYIPELEILDHWVGIEDDEGMLILKITRNIWGAGYVIVDADDYAYSIVQDSSTGEGEEVAEGSSYSTPSVGTLKPVGLGGRVRNDSLVWKAGGTTLYNDLEKGWILSNRSWGDGNCYQFSFSGGTASASPIGPWSVDPDRDPPSNLSFHFSWARWNRPSSWGAQTVYANYAPATTYVDSQVQGNIRVGTQCWNSSTFGRLYRTIFPDNYGYFYYLFSDGSGFAPTDSLQLTYQWENGGKTYTGAKPTAGITWTVAWTDGTNTGTETFNWVGWVEGIFEKKVMMCEIGRIL